MKEALEILAPAGRPKSTGRSCEVLAQGDLNCRGRRRVAGVARGLALGCRCLVRLGRRCEALSCATRLCHVDPASTFLALREVFRSQPEDVTEKRNSEGHGSGLCGDLPTLRHHLDAAARRLLPLRSAGALRPAAQDAPEISSSLYTRATCGNMW